MIVAALTVVGLVVGTAVVSASTHYADLCVAAASVMGVAGGSSGGSALASTGSSVNVGLWVLIGLGVLSVGAALTLVGRSGRPSSRVSS